MGVETTVALLTLFLVLGVVLLIVFLYIKTSEETAAEGSYFESEKGPIYYELQGKKGPWVVLIHGLGSSTYGWRYLVDSLKDDYRVLTFDLWGFGRSSKENYRSINLDSQVAVIEALITFLNIESYHVIGHSMGGEIALWMSLNDSRVEKCIAITPAANPRLISDSLRAFSWLAHLTPLVLKSQAIRRILLHNIHDASFITDEMVQNYYQPYTNPNAHRCFVAALNIIKDQRVFDSLKDLDDQVTLIWAQRDKVIRSRTRKAINSKVSGPTILTHPWSGHLLMEDDHLWLAQQVLLTLKNQKG